MTDPAGPVVAGKAHSFADRLGGGRPGASLWRPDPLIRVPAFRAGNVSLWSRRRKGVPGTPFCDADSGRQFRRGRESSGGLGGVNRAKQDAHDKSPQVGLRPAFLGGYRRSIRLTPTFVVSVKQSQLAAGGIGANLWRHKELIGHGMDYGAVKTKPIPPRRVLGRPCGASGPARQNKSVVRGRTTHSTIAQGKLYQENALRRHYEQGQSCRTKPIRPGRELVVTVGRARG
jgi:hypothetical protein